MESKPAWYSRRIHLRSNKRYMDKRMIKRLPTVFVSNLAKQKKLGGELI